MSYHIPSDEQLIKVLQKVMKKAHTINSQSLLRKIIQDELKKIDPSFGVSPQRLRKLAINSPFVSLEIQSREGNPNKILKGCPVCNHRLKKIKNLTIWGGEVTIEFQCPHCGYWTGKKKRVPTRYIFHYMK
jgi:hypothetical protein